jgi:Zn-dependent M16 (insulinase) family peptidase
MSFRLSDYFKLIKKEKIKENNTTVFFYEHQKTKASVIYFQNENQSASFGTFFKTPAENSKGTTHILEHSVFEGSRKYNQENSLDYLLNNSLASFFNAYTFPDKTMYLFCSSFKKDFLNVLDIYLDFVFFPNLDEKTLKKEGHFFKKNEQGYEFNGIVFNEMKNSLLSFNSKLYESFANFFLPGNYSHIYGGNPLDIVDLSIDELRTYHKDKYHPSNSHTIIYGKIDKSKVFNKLNEVFSQFDYEKKLFDIKATPIGENKKILIEYQDNDGSNNKFVKNYLFKGIKDASDFIGLDIARKYLLFYDFSPLKRLLEDSGLCSYIESHLEDELKFPILSIVCHDVEDKNIEKLEDLIDSNIYRLAKNIPTDIKESLLKAYSFNLKEVEFFQNQGEGVIVSAAKYLNHGLDPLIELRNSKNLKIIEKILKGKNLEEFFINKFLPAQTVAIKFVPSKKLLTEYAEEINKKLTLKLQNFDLQDLDKQIVEHEKYLNREKIEPKYPSIKKIKTQDLNLKVTNFDSAYKSGVIFTSINSEDLVRVSLNFDVSDFNFSKLDYLGIYIKLIDQLPTKNFTFEEFEILKKKYFANFYVDNLINHFNPKQNKKFIFVSLFTKFLLSDRDKTFEIIKEFILNVKFDDKERLKFLLQERYQSLKNHVSSDPQYHAVLKSISYMSEFDYINYQINSLPMLNRLKFMIDNFELEYNSLIIELKLIHNYIFNQNCIFNFGVSKEYSSATFDILDSFAKDLNIVPSPIENIGNLNFGEFKIPTQNKNFYLPSNSDTNFNIMAVKYKNFHESEKDLLKILEPYLHQYLWNHIRVKNGAYGARYHLDKDFSFSFFNSYSDPFINKTFKIYSNTKNNFELAKFKKSSFGKMKLKFLAEYNHVYSNSEIYTLAFNDFIESKDLAQKQNELNKRVSLNYNQFKNLFKYLKQIDFTVKVIATTPERIKEFNEEYETLI